jgi:hypothetical protein
MRTTEFDVLSKQIEQVVQEHIAASRRAVEAAVARAFAAASAPRRPVVAAMLRAPSGRRRGPAVLTELSEQLYRAVSAKPGESMAVFAIELSATVKELHRPMALLKRAGRVRSVGQRHLTRYYPMA